MIESILIIALIVLAIHYTMQEGEIFGSVGRWLGAVSPRVVHPALFECNVCMTPWYGSVLYILIYGVNLQWPIVVISAMGLQVVINKLSPDKDAPDLTDRVEDIESTLNSHGIYK